MEKQFSSMTINATEIGKAEDKCNINCTQFPSDFVFGVGSSAYQHEGGAVKGGRGPSIWDVFTLNAPGGRLSLGVNKEGIDYYNDLINTIIANDMKPFVTLFHFDLPHSLQQEYDGFLSRDVAEFFREYAELCFREFGDRVKYWMTLNEPWSYAYNGYVSYEFPPGVDHTTTLSNIINFSTILQQHQLLNAVPSNSIINNQRVNNIGTTIYKLYSEPDPPRDAHAAASNLIYYSGSKRKRDPAKDAYTVGRNLLLAHALAVHSYRTKFQERQKGQIGIALNTFWCEPHMKDDANDKEAAKELWILRWDAFSDGEAKMLKGSIDFLGLNYYTALYAANDPNPSHKQPYKEDQRLHLTYTDPHEKLIGPQAGSEWLHVYPEGIYNILIKYVNDKYKDKIPAIYITENGVDEKNDKTLTVKDACADSMREDYHKRHLVYLLKAMKDKQVPANVKGYFVWSWCDNFEWAVGYTVRFGLMYVDYENHQKRYPKASAIWFAKFLGSKKLLRAN
ncbi:UNVERIFIED_CONTAM: Raucaffricine-O-beta-D-glucosidase [Sesamum calycinum]|uniref:Raucaffricine-O-beta-D-glucosidase n=1 Tax=Sesamum calycinum TaxID=2727403 RepID=A0AAW2LY43_9LAMI